MSAGELAQVRNRLVGFVFQWHHLLGQCSALENVLIPTLAHGRPDKDAPARAMELLGRVGLADRSDHRPGQLSGGQCQRVAVARALINRPRLLLADEPTGSLDRDSREGLIDLLVELGRQEKLAMIVVTHSMDLARRMGRVMRLSGGVLVEGGDE
jgi:lipoprotein-releasing system ATP-binding protein